MSTPPASPRTPSIRDLSQHSPSTTVARAMFFEEGGDGVGLRPFSSNPSSPSSPLHRLRSSSNGSAIGTAVPIQFTSSPFSELTRPPVRSLEETQIYGIRSLLEELLGLRAKIGPEAIATQPETYTILSRAETARYEGLPRILEKALDGLSETDRERTIKELGQSMEATYSSHERLPRLEPNDNYPHLSQIVSRNLSTPDSSPEAEPATSRRDSFRERLSSLRTRLFPEIS